MGSQPYPIRILINVYDLDERYKWLKGLGVGLFHTAVEIAGREIGYGGHQYKGTGIFFAAPLQMEAPASFAAQICAGETQKSYMEIAEIIRELAFDWLGSNYNLLRHNCNHFTEELLARLCGRGALPSYVNRAACVADIFGCYRCLGAAPTKKGRRKQLDLRYGPNVGR